MKKLLNIIGASVILSSSAVVASCSLDPSAPIEINDAIDLQNFFNKLQNNRPELSSDYNVAFDGQNAKYIAALEEIFDQEQVVRTPFIQKLLKADFYDNDKSTIGYDIQKTGQVLGGGSLVRGADHKVIPDVANKKLSDYFYEKVAKPDEKPVDNRVALSTVVTSKDLGEIANNDADTILNAVKSKNGGLNIDEVEIKDIKDKSATVATKSGSTVYTGSVNVTFTTTPVDTTKPLTEDITDTKLGEIANNDADTILNAVKSKNSGLNIDEVEVKDIKDESATVAAKSGSTVYTGSVNVTFTTTPVDTTKPLTEDITDTKLGEIANNDADTILNAVKSKNSGLNIDEVEVKDIKDESATVAAKSGSTVYTGSVNVTFTTTPVDTTKPLTEDITDTKLGEIANNDADTILNAVKSKNSGLNIDEVEVKDIKDESATVAAKSGSTVYTGSVNVTFTTTPEVTTKPLTDDLTDTKLGDIKDKSESAIENALTDKNKNLNVSQITITDITDTGAKVNVIENSTVYDAGGNVSVTFTLKSEAVELNTIITAENSALGEINSPDEAGIKAGLTAKIPELNQDEITITPVDDTSATIAPKDGSTVYTGDSVTVTFTLKSETVELNTVITAENSALGEIDSPDEAGIKAGLTAKIPELNQEEITITPVDDTSATIAAKDDSTVYSGSVEVTFTLPEAPTMNYYSILNMQHLLADGPEYSYDDYTMTIMIGSEELLNLDNNGYVYIPFTILPK
jgi:preprotein translocase subunit YajC/DNA-binding protein